MRKFRRIPLTFTLMCSLSGCGTTANLCWFAPYEGGRQPYGGVSADLAVIRDCFAQSEAERGQPGGVGGEYEIMAIAMMIDLPLSAVGDTITLPMALAMYYADRAANAHQFPPNEAPSSDAGPSSAPES